jgi:O-antigen ligase
MAGLRRTALVVVGAATAGGIGMATAVSWQAAALVVLGLAATALTITGSWVLPLAAVPAAFVDFRLPLGEVASVSVADVAVATAAVGAALHLDWTRNRTLLGVLAALGVFEFGLGLGFAINPSAGALLEMTHRVSIVGGSLLIGAFLAQRDRIGWAIASFLTVAAIFGVAGLVDSARNGFTVGFPFGQEKNYAASLLSSALLLSFVASPVRPALRALLRLSQLTTLVGLLATQSRGAIIGLAIGSLVFAFRVRRYRLPLLISAAVFVPFLVANVDNELITNSFGSAASHVRVATEAYETWRQSPVFGRGIRFFASAASGLAFDPHNIVLLTLAESGVVGLAGFVCMLTWTAVQLWKRKTLLATAALALLVGRFAHGMVDIYWVHGSQEIPWVVAGMALAAVSLSSPAKKPGTSSTIG